MLLIRNRMAFERAREVWERLPSVGAFASAIDAVGSFCRAAFYQRPWFGLFALPVGGIVDAELDLMNKSGFDPHRASLGALSVLVRRLESVDFRIKASRRNAAILREAAEWAGLEPPREATWGRHSYFQFPIRFPSVTQRNRAIVHLAERGVDSIPFYQDTPDIARARHGYRRGTCPVAEEFAGTVLTVPCHAHLSAQDVGTVANALKSLGGRV
jgi:hypothetical protein